MILESERRSDIIRATQNIMEGAKAKNTKNTCDTAKEVILGSVKFHIVVNKKLRTHFHLKTYRLKI